MEKELQELKEKLKTATDEINSYKGRLNKLEHRFQLLESFVYLDEPGLRDLYDRYKKVNDEKEN